MEIKLTNLLRLKELIGDIDMEKAIQFCAGSEEFYIECLKDYSSNGRKENIEQAYATENWKSYGIEVHTLKGTSRTLGFDKLGDIAEKMQTAAETMDIQYVKEHNCELIEEFKRILCAIAECI